MKYETPELTALTPAIHAIQGMATKGIYPPLESFHEYEAVGAYQDWQ